MIKTFFIGLVFVLSLALFAAFQTYRSLTPPHPSTWSVVALDPATGDVGVAGASCVGVPIDGLAALVPGVGVASIQAAFTLKNRNRVFELLQAGIPASEVIASVRGEDNASNQRQYGVITLNDGSPDTAQHTGAANGDWAGHASAQAVFPVTVQGNILESEEVVSAALAAFNDPDLGEVTLPDRLLRALEAGSAAGGDKRCNSAAARQTAAASFILMARGDEEPFVVESFGESAADTENAPFLALSVSKQTFDANPLLELRESYDAWRAEALPPCSDCVLEAIAVPPGGTPELAAQEAAELRSSFRTVILLALALLFVIVAAFAFFIVYWRRRRKSEK